MQSFAYPCLMLTRQHALLSLFHNWGENSRIPIQPALALPSISNFHIFVYKVEVWTVVLKTHPKRPEQTKLGQAEEAVKSQAL